MVVGLSRRCTKVCNFSIFSFLFFSQFIFYLMTSSTAPAFAHTAMGGFSETEIACVMKDLLQVGGPTFLKKKKIRPFFLSFFFPFFSSHPFIFFRELPTCTSQRRFTVTLREEICCSPTRVKSSWLILEFLPSSQRHSRSDRLSSAAHTGLLFFAPASSFEKKSF